MDTTLQRRLVERGVSPTPQRLAVYAEVAGRRDHPSADEVFMALRGRLPTLSKTTVYATMQLLAGRGLIRTVHGEGEERRYDGEPAFHAHFHCRACGGLFDLPASAAPAVPIPAGFEPETEELNYYGFCPACAKRKGRGGDDA